MARWNRIFSCDVPFSGYENQTVRIAYAYIELHQRKPVACLLVEGSLCRFNSDGKLDQTLLNANLPSLLDNLILPGERKDSVVINAGNIFRKMRYKNLCTWEPGPVDVNNIIAVIWK